jgi:hypothetical protein
MRRSSAGPAVVVSWIGRFEGAASPTRTRPIVEASPRRSPTTEINAQ